MKVSVRRDKNLIAPLTPPRWGGVRGVARGSILFNEGEGS